jgi:hypothetical protein
MSDSNPRRWRARILPDLAERFMHCARLGLALVLGEIRLELLLGPIRIQEKLLPRSESQSAYVTIANAGRDANKPYDSEIPVRHLNIIAGAGEGVKSPAGVHCLFPATAATALDP